MKVLLLAVALAACATPAAQGPPDGVAECMEATKPPPAPRPPRTTEAIAAWSIKLQLAREATEAARDDCAGKLAELNAWVKDHPR